MARHSPLNTSHRTPSIYLLPPSKHPLMFSIENNTLISSSGFISTSIQHATPYLLSSTTPFFSKTLTLLIKDHPHHHNHPP